MEWRSVATVLVLLGVVVGMALAERVPLPPLPPHMEVHPTAPSPTTLCEVILCLPQPGKEELIQRASAFNDPSHPWFGLSMSAEEVDALMTPGEEVRDRVLEWLIQEAPDHRLVADYGDALRVRLSISAAERLLRTHIVLVRGAGAPAEGGIPKAIGSIEWPEDVPVELVAGLTTMPPPPRRRVTAPTPGGPLHPPRRVQKNNQAIPAVARQLSAIPEGMKGSSKAPQGIVEFGLTLEHETGQLGGGGGGFQFSDLQLAASLSAVPFVNVSTIIGPFRQTNFSSNAESLLDLQYVLGVAPASPASYETVIDGWMLEWAMDVVHRVNPARAYSLSYGTPENLNCNASLNGQTRPPCGPSGVPGYLERSDTELAKLAAMRIGVFASSGDNGAPSFLNRDCSLDTSTYPLHPSYPATSPWVTAVGGISVREPSDTIIPVGPQPPICRSVEGMTGTYCAAPPYTTEVSSYINGGITSGGGFSNYTASPSYQHEAVRGYLAKMAHRLPPPHVFKKGNRAYPDVSQLATNVLIVIDGKVISGAGTSASSPLTAGIASTLSAALVDKGLPPVGFLNPSVYGLLKESPSANSAFVDVTIGSNNCTEAACCAYGFPAAPGWDPSTGAGAIRFTPMFEFLEKNMRAARALRESGQVILPSPLL